MSRMECRPLLLHLLLRHQYLSCCCKSLSSHLLLYHHLCSRRRRSWVGRLTLLHTTIVRGWDIPWTCCTGRSLPHLSTLHLHWITNHLVPGHGLALIRCCHRSNNSLLTRTLTSAVTCSASRLLGLASTWLLPTFGLGKDQPCLTSLGFCVLERLIKLANFFSHRCLLTIV